MVTYWDFIRRIESGEIVSEADYDRKIGQVAQDMVQKYDIRYTPDDPVPAGESRS